MAAPQSFGSDFGRVLRFHHFEVLSVGDGKPWVLGKGADGVTYKASDTILRRAVALKVVDDTLLIDVAARGRLIDEARVLAALKHPNSAAVYYFGEEGDACFYAMELVEGQSLEHHIRSHGTLPPQHALEVAAQVAAALGAAHDLGIVHRDVKPANVMLSSDLGGGLSAKLVDFGLAAPQGIAPAGEASDEFAGTPLYASPEQLDGAPPDARSDVYSLGAVLYFMLGGRAPFEGKSIAELAEQHTMKEVPVHLLAGLPVEISALVLRFMAKDPAARPIDGAEARSEIEEILRRYRHSADRTAREWLRDRFAQVEQAGFLEGGILYKVSQTRGAEELAVFHFDNSARGLVAADRMRTAVPMVRAIKTNSARRVLDMADTSDGLVVVCEWMSGTRLLSVLRVRRSLPSQEARLVLLPVAQVLDEAAAAGMALPHVGLRDVFLQPLANAGTPLTQWQDLRAAVDLLPLAEAREADINATVVGRSLGLAGSFAYASSGQNAASIIASLAYEVLGGTTAPRAGFYVPLPELSENANRTLRRVFEEGGAGITASALISRVLSGGHVSVDWSEENTGQVQPKRSTALPSVPLPPPEIAASHTSDKRGKNILVTLLTVLGGIGAAAVIYAVVQPRGGAPSVPEQMPSAKVAERPDTSAAHMSVADLLAEADKLEAGSSPADALAPLEQALAMQPTDATMLSRIATLHERLGQTAQAADTWQKLVALGPAAGNLSKVAEVRLNLLRHAKPSGEGPEVRDENGLQPGSSLGVVDLKLDGGKDGAVKDLRLAVKARPGELIDARDVRINVTFYETLDGEILPTMSRVQSMWFTMPVDWKSDGVEILEVKYEVPRIGPDGGPPPQYYGYMVNIYHRGQLQETRASPENLRELFPPPAMEKLVDGPSPRRLADNIKPPFGMKWGERASRIKQVISKARAGIVRWEVASDSRQVWVVKGIKQEGLSMTYFYFSNGRLDEIELHYDRTDWDEKRVASWVSTIKRQADIKYGYSIKMPSDYTDSYGRLLACWRWPGLGTDLQLSFYNVEEDARGADRVVLSYSRKDAKPDVR